MKNVGIIAGGYSSEREVSVKSATNIYNNFPDGYNPYLIILQKSGWTVRLDDNEVPFDFSDFSFYQNGNRVQIDLAVVFTHGDPGENGKIQAYLEIIGIPYINSGPLASELSFDKWYCNQFLKGFDIKVADSIYLSDNKAMVDTDEIVAKLGLPVFVKPCDSGSSFGIARVNKAEDLVIAVENAFREGASVVIEAFLDGKEITCGVYRDSAGVHALPLTEIVSKNEFFDYAAKYQGLSDEITPARIGEAQAQKISELSVKIYKILKLRSIARIDFMLIGDEPYLIEVNTIPGFTNESIVPKMVDTKGLTTKELWTRILEAEDQ